MVRVSSQMVVVKVAPNLIDPPASQHISQKTAWLESWDLIRRQSKFRCSSIPDKFHVDHRQLSPRRILPRWPDLKPEKSLRIPVLAESLSVAAIQLHKRASRDIHAQAR